MTACCLCLSFAQMAANAPHSTQHQAKRECRHGDRANTKERRKGCLACKIECINNRNISRPASIHIYIHALAARRQGITCRQAAGKGCHSPTPCWNRQIQARPNQPWARCSAFLPPRQLGPLISNYIYMIRLLLRVISDSYLLGLTAQAAAVSPACSNLVRNPKVRNNHLCQVVRDR